MEGRGEDIEKDQDLREERRPAHALDVNLHHEAEQQEGGSTREGGEQTDEGTGKEGGD